MRIAFYAPLKSPNHDVPSGDREMARLLTRALALAGHTVELASELRSFSATPSEEHYAGVRREADIEIARLSSLWRGAAPPDLWFTYHPYYKAPDYIGPALAERFAIPYVTAEASYSARRNIGAWADTQAVVAAAIRRASLNICMTKRDHDGLLDLVAADRLAMLPPFIDTARFGGQSAGREAPNLVTVAMMRPGDKLESYRMLARYLTLCLALPWELSVVGDGPASEAVREAFAAIPPDRLNWLGERPMEEISAILARGDIFVWPGFGEAYGLAYLEAQAAGLPVVAQNVAGVPEVVRDGETGHLVPTGDADAFAAAVTGLLEDAAARRRMGEAARRFVLEERSLEGAARRLGELLATVTE